MTAVSQQFRQILTGAAQLARTDNKQAARELRPLITDHEKLQRLYHEQQMTGWPVVDGDPFTMDMVTFHSALMETARVLHDGHQFAGEQLCVQLAESIKVA